MLSGYCLFLHILLWECSPGNHEMGVYELMVMFLVSFPSSKICFITFMLHHPFHFSFCVYFFSPNYSAAALHTFINDSPCNQPSHLIRSIGRIIWIIFSLCVDLSLWTMQWIQTSIRPLHYADNWCIKWSIYPGLKDNTCKSFPFTHVYHWTHLHSLFAGSEATSK